MASVALGLLSASCTETLELNPDGFAPGDLIVAIHVVDGRQTATRVKRSIGTTLQLPADPDTGVALFRLPQSALFDVRGQPLSDADVASLEACLNRADAPCPRCLVPSADGGFIAAPGQACPLVGSSSALYGPDGACLGSPEGVHCGEATADVERELSDLGALVRLLLPGESDAQALPDPIDLARLAIGAVAPGRPPNVLHSFSAEGEQIFGLGEDILTISEPGQAPRNLTFDNLGARPTAILRRDDHLLVTALRPSLFSDTRDLFFRFQVSSSGEVQPPEPLSWSTDILSSGLIRRGDDVWSYGLRAAFGGFIPALASCRDPFGCQSVALGTCEERIGGLEDMVVTSAGRGVALADKAVFSGPLDPQSPPWTCAVVSGRASDGQRISIKRLRHLVARQDRLYVCAQAEGPECAPRQDYVLSSTAAGASWSVAWTVPGDRPCQDLLPVPGRADGVRIRYDDQLVDLLPGSAASEPVPVSSAYGAVPGAFFTTLVSDAVVLARGRGGRAHRVDGPSPQQVWGPEEPFPSDWVHGARRPGGGFLLVSETGDLASVSLDGDVQRLAYPEALRDRGAPVIAVDEARSLVLLVAGDGTFAVLDGEGLDPRIGQLPTELGSPQLAASMGAAGFVVLDNRTGAARVFVTDDGPQAEALTIDMDDPSTPDPERWLPAAPDPCSGAASLNDWRDVAGAEGAAWAIGQRGLLVRFTARGGVRRRMPVSLDAGAIRVDRADRVTLAGRGIPQDTQGEILPRLQVWQLALDGTFESPLKEELVTAIVASGISDLFLAQSVRIFGREQRDSPSAPMLLDNGLVVRLGSDERFVYRRVPFSPQGAVQDRSGRILFYGKQGRLALGRP